MEILPKFAQETVTKKNCPDLATEQYLLGISVKVFNGSNCRNLSIYVHVIYIFILSSVYYDKINTNVRKHKF